MLGGAVFLLNIAVAFLPTQPDPQIMASLNTIQVVTNETLSRVKDIQKSLTAVSTQLEGLKILIQDLNCNTATDRAMTAVDAIEGFWIKYYGKSGQVQPSNGSFVGQMLEAVTAGLSTFPAVSLDPSLVGDVDKWAEGVVDAAGVLTSINSIYNTLAEAKGGATLLQRCGGKIAEQVRASNPLPFDDRLYYQELMQLTAFYASWQTRGLQMLREAYHWRATSRYSARLNASVAATCGGVLTPACAVWTRANLPASPDELCAIAVELPANSTSPVRAAQSDCRQLVEATALTQQFVVHEIELTGAPYSAGDAKGQGVRLVLGTNATVSTDRRAVLEATTKQDFIDLPSFLLVPASPGEFDPGCVNATSMAPACSLLAPWDRVGDASSWSGLYFPASYAAGLWTPANSFEWFALRYGMNVSAMYNGGDIPNAMYAGNLLHALESTLEGSNQVPFSGLSDRTWAINGSIDIALPDLIRPSGAPWLDDIQVPTDGYQGNSYWIGRRVRIKGARTFANSGAGDRRYGPAGVVISSPDYRSVLSGRCDRLIWVGSSNNPNDFLNVHRGEYCLNYDCTLAGTVTDNPLRFSCAQKIDFALSCPIYPTSLIKEAFPPTNAREYGPAIRVQCPAYPYMWETDVGFKSGKPYYPRCGLSFRDNDVQFDGTSGTDSTCCFEQTRDGRDTCDDLSDRGDPERFTQPSCNRYNWKDIGYCQDMQRCLGGGRLEYPFLAGAWLDTGEGRPCFSVPQAPEIMLPRLPVLDIRNIPRVLSPFTKKDGVYQPYCDVDR